MKLQLNCARFTDREYWQPGDVVIVSDDEGRRMLEAGQAELVPESPVETATVGRQHRNTMRVK